MQANRIDGLTTPSSRRQGLSTLLNVDSSTDYVSLGGPARVQRLWS